MGSFSLVNSLTQVRVISEGTRLRYIRMLTKSFKNDCSIDRHLLSKYSLQGRLGLCIVRLGLSLTISILLFILAAGANTADRTFPYIPLLSVLIVKVGVVIAEYGRRYHPDLDSSLEPSFDRSHLLLLHDRGDAKPVRVCDKSTSGGCWGEGVFEHFSFGSLAVLQFLVRPA